MNTLSVSKSRILFIHSLHITVICILMFCCTSAKKHGAKTFHKMKDSVNNGTSKQLRIKGVPFLYD